MAISNQSSNVQTPAFPNAPANQYQSPNAPSQTSVMNKVAPTNPAPAPVSPPPQINVPPALQIKSASTAPIAPAPVAPPQSFASSFAQRTNPNPGFPQIDNPLTIPKADAQSPSPQATAFPLPPSPISMNPEPASYRLAPSTLQGWLDNPQVTPQAAFAAANAVDSRFSAGNARLAADMKAQGLPSDYTDPVFIARAFNEAYGIGKAPAPNQDMAALMQALQQFQASAPDVPQPVQTPQGQTLSSTDPGFMQGMDKSMEGNVQGIVQAGRDFSSGKQGLLDTGLQMGGNAVSGVLQPVTHTIAALLSPFQAVTGKLNDAADSLGQYLAGTDAGKKIAGSIVNAPGSKEVMEPLKNLVSTIQAHANDPQEKSFKAVGQAAMDALQAFGAYHAANAAMDQVPNLAQAAKDNIVNPIKENVVQPTADVTKSLVNRAQGFTPADTAARAEANAGYQDAIAKSKTTMDLAQPKLVGDAIDQAANDKILAEDGEGHVTGYSGSTPKQDAIAAELDKVPGIDPTKPGASIAATKEQIGTLSDQARSELTMQAKQQPIFQTKAYQDTAIKDVRSTLSDAIQTPENSTLFDDTEMKQVQRISNVAENKYAEFLKAANGEKEVAKLDLRQWLDKQVPDASWNKDLAELPLRTRTYRIFRGAISDSLDAGAQKIGGTYQPIMDRISNLYKGLDSMRTHLPNSQQSLVDQFTVPGKQELPNEVPLKPKELLKVGAVKAAKIGAAAFGAREILH